MQEVQNIQNLNSVYNYFKFQYLLKIPKKLRSHRNYFTLDQRGFGEDTFHAAWYAIFSELKPANCLEIGVYRGQVISLWAMLQDMLKIEGQVWGLSPLEPLGDQVSDYIPIEYAQDIANHFQHFGLCSPNLLKARSDSRTGKKFISGEKWNLIYIDGGHDEETVMSDFLVAFENLESDGLLVLDDSSLYLDYFPDADAFAGHPGPSKVLRDQASKKLEHFLTVGHLNFLRKNKD